MKALLTKKTAIMQQKLMNRLDGLYTEIKGQTQVQKESIVRKYAKQVYEKGGLGGGSFYCVMFARAAGISLQDSILDRCIPDPTKVPQNFKTSFGGRLGSHPNVSCSALMADAEQRYGDNYIRRGKKDYAQAHVRMAQKQEDKIKPLNAAPICLLQEQRQS